MASVDRQPVTTGDHSVAVTAPPRLCALCEGDLPRGRSDRRYCSNACRQRAHRMVRSVEVAGGLIPAVREFMERLSGRYSSRDDGGVTHGKR